MANWQCIRLSDVLRSERIQQHLLRPLLYVVEVLAAPDLDVQPLRIFPS